MELVNLTPHTITLVDEYGRVIKDIPPSGNVVRVLTTDTPTNETAFGTQIVHKKFDSLVGLPDPVSGVQYIVSAISALYAAQFLGRTADLLTPGTLVRNTDGSVVGCRSFCRMENG